MKTLLVKPLSPKLYIQLRRLKFKIAQPDVFNRLQDKRKIYTKTSYSYKPFDDTKSIFIHIPKCAGISVSKALYDNLAGGHTTLDGYLNIFEPSEISSYFKFTIVRNPWDRIVSAFHFLKAGGFSDRDKIWSEHNLKYFSDFGDFVKTWLNKDNIWKYYHFHPQYHYILDANNKVELDFVGFFENLNDDFNYVTAKLGGNSKLAHTNSTPRNNYQTYYDNETKRIVEEVYAKDIALLGYNFDNSNIGLMLKSRTLSCTDI